MLVNNVILKMCDQVLGTTHFHMLTICCLLLKCPVFITLDISNLWLCECSETPGSK